MRHESCDVQQNGKTANLPQQLQKLGLPVFKRIAHHLDGVGADFQGLLMCELLVRIGEPAEYTMAGQREDEQGTRHPREAVSSPDG